MSTSLPPPPPRAPTHPRVTRKDLGIVGVIIVAVFLMVIFAVSDAGQGVTVWVTLVALYFAPTIIAISRKVPNAGSVMIINLFLGWSLIGWVVALAMAARTVPPR